MSLQQALTDLKQEVLNGGEMAALVNSVAADYGVHPTLLARKFSESYGSEATLRATAQATSVAVNVTAKIAETIEEMCRRYGVPASATRLMLVNGKPYTFICRVDACTKYKYRAVSHADGSARKIHHAANITEAN